MKPQYRTDLDRRKDHVLENDSTEFVALQDGAVTDSSLNSFDRPALFDIAAAPLGSASDHAAPGGGATEAQSSAVNDATSTLVSGTTSTLANTAQVNSTTPVTIAEGATVEIGGVSTQPVIFTGTTGTLKLGDSLAFTGQVTGLAGSDALDLADVHYSASTTATFSGDMNGGTLTVSDGANTANIALVGDYLASGWTLASDGNGGTVVVDPSLYPNASNTGVQAGVHLATYSGTLKLSTPGQVVSGLIITGGVQISASNVTLENCIIEVPSTANWNIGVAGGLTGVNIENCEIVGAGSSGPQGSYGIYVQGNSQVTINAVNIHDVGQGLVLNDGQVTLENSYIHDLHAGSGTHYEDIGYFGAATSSTFSLNIQSNTLINQNNQTASVFLQNYFGAVNNVTVNNNILVGGDYTVYMDGTGDGGPGTGTAVTNVSFTNNHMGAGIFGYTYFNGWSNPVYTGSVNDGATLVGAAGFQSPTVSGASATAGTYTAGSTIMLTLYTSEAVSVSGIPTLTLNDGGTATYTGGSGTNALIFSYTVAAGQNTSALVVTAVSGTITDLDGHALNSSSMPATFSGVAIGSTGPSVTSIAESPSTGDLNAGNVVTLTLNMSSAVTVSGGTPTLTLNDGGTATYTGGSGTGALTFSYTVGAGDTNVASLAAISGQSQWRDDQGWQRKCRHSLAEWHHASRPQIDTNTVISAISETPSSGDLNVGKTVTYSLTMNEAVTVNTTGGSPTLALNDGGTATYVGGSGSNTLTFSYTVLAGQNTPDLMVSSVNLNGATVSDGAGNTANLSLTGLSQGSPQIDTTAPTVSSVAASGTGITAGAGDLGAGKVVTLTLNLSETVTVAGGTPTLTLNDGGTATYSGGSGTNALTFSYTVGAGQNTADLAVTAVNLGTATVRDGAGNAADLTGAVTNPAGTLQIDTTAATVSSVVASGTGITAGAGDVGVGSVVTLTVNLSEAVTVAGGTPTLTLNDGGTATYTRRLRHQRPDLQLHGRGRPEHR